MDKFKEKEYRKEVFEETLTLLKEKEDKIKNSKSILYREDAEISLPKENLRGDILIVNKTTLQAARDFKDRVAILNFASGTNPGGGVTKGSNAQEESICRVSSLYPKLNTNFLINKFYQYHRDKKDCFYSNKIIYTNDVLIFREDSAPYNLLGENEFFVDVISSPAPNLRNLEKINESELLEILVKRIIRILEIAVINNDRNIVLGAFGCGAFANPPEIVAKAFKKVIFDRDYRKHFNTIVFAIIDNKYTNNFEIFNSILKDPQLIDCRPENI